MTTRRPARPREYERTQRQRAIERRKEEAAKAKERQRREQAIAKAQAALDKAKREHDVRAGAIEVERAALETRRKPRTPDGKSRKKNWRGLCAGRGNSGSSRCATLGNEPSRRQPPFLVTFVCRPA